jgi:hypothetical protein
MSQIVLLAIDPNRADMLVQIQAGVERLMSGQDPYFVYHVPWELPLSYGPWLWMWFIIPYVLRSDLRLVTIFGQVFVPTFVAIAANCELATGRVIRAILLGGLAMLVLGNPLFDRFLLIGHTPAYWPLIVLFATLSCAGRTRAAATVLGALVCARTPMVALVPVFLMHVWTSDRRNIVAATLILTATVGLSFAPFLIWNWRLVVYGLYGNYIRVVKEFVWTQTGWMNSTLGLTRLLLREHRGRFVELAQALSLTIVWALTWWRLRANDRPAPWFCLSLLVFCMTTLWPVWYIFLDVFLLGICLFVADEVPAIRASPWLATFGATALVTLGLLATLIYNPGVYYTVQAGTAPRWYLRSGFGDDQIENGKPFAWATRQTVHMRLPRGFTTRAELDLECEPFVTPAFAQQTVSATLNGFDLGAVPLRPGWQTISFGTRSRYWHIGHNDLTLSFAYAAPTTTGEVRAVRFGRVTIARSK